MSSDAEAYSSLPLAGQVLAPPLRAARHDAVYDRIFWLTYLANGLTTIANAMLVRYADFVTVMGGEEQQLGFIVGFGMLGSIAMRLVLGVSIDHYGAGRIWQCAILVFTGSLLAHLFIRSAYGPQVFLARAILQTSLAGVFGASITFLSLRVPPQRMAEVIGTQGTSGFIGMMIGPLIGDWLCGGPLLGRVHIDRLFMVAASVALLAAVSTWFATQGAIRPLPRRRPSLWRLVKRYTLFRTMIVSAAMGAGLAIPMTFLRPFAAELKVSRIGLYFTVYAISAFTARLATRQLFERHGNRRWIMTGMVLLTISFFLYLPVQRTWHMVLPGMVAGVAHAFLFPSVMSEGSTAFPRRFRGVATSVTLAMFDMGTFLGAPVVGAFLAYAKQHTTSAYPMMFGGAALVFLLVSLMYGWPAAAKPRVA